LRQRLTERYGERLAGVLSCYDRIIVTGTLPGVCYAHDAARFRARSTSHSVGPYGARSACRGAPPKYPFETEAGAILCRSPFAIKDAKAALGVQDKDWFDKTGCVRAASGLRVVLIEAPLAASSIGGPSPSSNLPWGVRVYSPDKETAPAARRSARADCKCSPCICYWRRRR
jgi:hypothetical protein